MPENDGTQQTVVRARSDQSGVIGIAGIDSATPVVVKTMAVWQLILVRAARMYLGTFFGLLGLDSFDFVTIVPEQLPPMEHVLGAMTASLMPTGLALAWNFYEFLQGIDIKAPQWRA